MFDGDHALTKARVIVQTIRKRENEKPEKARIFADRSLPICFETGAITLLSFLKHTHTHISCSIYTELTRYNPRIIIIHRSDRARSIINCPFARRYVNCCLQEPDAARFAFKSHCSTRWTISKWMEWNPTKRSTYVRVRRGKFEKQLAVVQIKKWSLWFYRVDMYQRNGRQFQTFFCQSRSHLNVLQRLIRFFYFLFLIFNAMTILNGERRKFRIVL